jgi:plasmid replication initiation protein
MEDSNKILLKIHNDVNLLRLKNFNLYDYKILFTICSEVLEKGTELVQIPYSRLKNILNLNSTKTITDKYLEDIVKTTHEKQKLINFNINNKFFEGEASLFTEIYKSKVGEKMFIVEVSKKTKYYLNKLAKEYTIANLKTLNSLKSKYSYRLFLELRQFKNANKKKYGNTLCCWRNFEIQDFRYVMDIPESYRMRDIDKQVINISKEELKPFFKFLEFEKIKKSGKVTNLIIYFDFAKEEEFEIEFFPNYNISAIEEYFNLTFLTMKYTDEIKNKLEKLESSLGFEQIKKWLEESWLFIINNKSIKNKEGYFANLIVNGIAILPDKKKEEIKKLEEREQAQEFENVFVPFGTKEEEEQRVLYKNVFSSEKIEEDIKEPKIKKIGDSTVKNSKIELEKEEFEKLRKEYIDANIEKCMKERNLDRQLAEGILKLLFNGKYTLKKEE